MRCGFVTDGLTCPRQPEEGRRIPIAGHQIEVLLCSLHAQIVDNTKKGETECQKPKR